MAYKLRVTDMAYTKKKKKLKKTTKKRTTKNIGKRKTKTKKVYAGGASY
jgi:hypothetical protein